MLARRLLEMPADRQSGLASPDDDRFHVFAHAMHSAFSLILGMTLTGTDEPGKAVQRDTGDLIGGIRAAKTANSTPPLAGEPRAVWSRRPARGASIRPRVFPPATVDTHSFFLYKTQPLKEISS